MPNLAGTSLRTGGLGGCREGPGLGSNGLGRLVGDLGGAANGEVLLEVVPDDLLEEIHPGRVELGLVLRLGLDLEVALIVL